MTQQAETISIQQFKQMRTGKGAGATPSWQYLKAGAMPIGTALRMSHEGLAHKSSGACSFSSVITKLNEKYPDRRFSRGHAENGDLLVACYPREGTE